jgi:hypothetical protein
MAITTLKIFPAIGIARIGNSPEFFIGPEIPGVRTPPPGGYKDKSCRVKRQAAQFRLYAFDENKNLIIENGKPKEITMADAEITWTVELANIKSSWKRFDGLNQNAPLRNIGVADRSSLEIRPGPRSLDGPNQAGGFNTGKFLGKIVPLGEMRTDAEGRLLVVGGFGNSASVPPGLGLPNYANNDGWHDDVSDGPVKATVKINGNPIPVVPAWVICPPPDFAPPLDSITTLYDTLFQVAVSQGLLSAPAKPSFTNDIFPILQRVLDLKRVNQLVASGHFSFTTVFPPGGTAAQRLAILGRMRDPNNPSGPTSKNMPLLWDDSYGRRQVVTKLQYSAIQKWTGTEGVDWINDWTGSPPPPPADITPDGLTRAALEACVGGAFYPGIEASWFLRDVYNYTEPFRLDHTGRVAGDVTKQMAVPWQADFRDCYEYDGCAWWPAQRPDFVFPEAGGGPVDWIRDLVTSYGDMVNNWYKLGFIVSKGGNFVETERRVVCSNIFLITDRSHFSEDEVAGGAPSVATPATFPDSLYVVAESFLPSELGVMTANPTPAQLVAIAPVVTITRANNTAVPDMKATPQALLLQNNSLPATLRQRFTFVYQIEFTSTAGFNDDNNSPIESQVVTVTAAKTVGGDKYTSTGFLTLFHQPNPYMLDGPVSWLSTDVRVFQVTEGASPFGLPIGAIGNTAAGAQAFIDKVVTTFNSLPQVGHPFNSMSTDQNLSKLELSEKVNNKRVFNFAVARVRYRGNVLSANGVRVFFRLFTTAATGLDYAKDFTYRRTPNVVEPISLLGLQAGYVVSIPCYGRARVDTSAVSLDTQTDDLNVQNLQPSGPNEFHGYFGCWLDFNQTAPQFPLQPNPKDGKWTSGRLSIQELIRGQHQCLVAEVYFPQDLIPEGASPASNDNLAQRNLAIVESPNPGDAPTRTVQHTFEIKATSAQPRPQSPAFVAIADHALASSFVQEAGPDELMIRWNNLPRTTRMTIYFPDVDSGEALRLAGQSYDTTGLERVDAHTIVCLPADVTYVPIPPGRTRNIAALLSLELPEGIREEQAFRVVLRQISGRPRSILGAFQLSVPVSNKPALLKPEIRKLSVLRHIARSIPQDDQWHHVFVRYLDQIADRVRGFGGDPDRVAPSPDGSGRDEAAERCARRGWIFSALLALLIIVAAWHPLSGYLAEIMAGIGAAWSFVVWWKKCAPPIRAIMVSALIGLVAPIAVLAILLLVGVASSRGPIVILLVAVVLGALVIAGLRARVFALAGE